MGEHSKNAGRDAVVMGVDGVGREKQTPFTCSPTRDVIYQQRSGQTNDIDERPQLISNIIVLWLYSSVCRHCG